MKKIIVWILVPLLQLYWFIFRPETYGAKGLVIKDGKVLLVKTSYSRHFTIPGGGIKRGESPEDAMKRELKEETGIEVLQYHLVGEYLNRKEYKNDHISLFYIDEFKIGSKPKTIEIDTFDFFPLYNLPDKASPATKRKVRVDSKGLEKGEW